MLESTIKIKPLSVNRAWKGRRFKTDDYKAYEQELLYRMVSAKVPTGDLSVHLKFAFSSRGSDIDNPIKPLLDILQKKFTGFNDNKIYTLLIEKEIVPKGEEFLNFKIEEKTK